MSRSISAAPKLRITVVSVRALDQRECHRSIGVKPDVQCIPEILTNLHQIVFHLKHELACRQYDVADLRESQSRLNYTSSLYVHAVREVC